jgi:hypothetical protein
LYNLFKKNVIYHSISELNVIFFFLRIKDQLKITVKYYS